MHNVEALRAAIFDTIAKLKEGKIDINQAKAIGDLGQVIINSAKVEVQYAQVNEKASSSFFLEDGLAGNQSLTETGIKEVNGGMTFHRIK